MSAIWIKLNDTHYRVDLFSEDTTQQMNIASAISNLFDVPHKPIHETYDNFGNVIGETEWINMS